ncbi:unnamed protein product [Bemisia tabaci]|uniref:sphinganine-1-phosphate aldolase n=1 Tax=Bemisia tabaci TaxID=7038 RepID=A0A9P0F742_BEMTA|nr:unnamed protein product [Bemisia tabaci]
MASIVGSTLNLFTSSINSLFKNQQPWEIVAITSSTILFLSWAWQVYEIEESLFSRGKKKFFKLARKIPFVSKKLETELDKIRELFHKDTVERLQETSYCVSLPKEAKTETEIMDSLQKFLNLGEFEWEKGFISGAIYCENKALKNLVGEVYKLTSYTNPLHPDVFPGICFIEADIIRMAANLFHGTHDTCGSVTSGGTESIVMACKAYRDYAEATKGITNPVILLPTTAHPAFDKGCAYFKVYAKHVKVDPVTFKVDIQAMEKAISKNTILLVGSAPNFPYGTMDDIVAIAALGRKYNIPVHVDSCLGGFLTAFMPHAGFEVEPCDFSVPGVTSISADTHKYGFTPKGSSVILYAHPKYRHHQYFVVADWPGGTYGSPSMNGSRTGGLIAAAWATLLYFGFDGYVKATKKLFQPPDILKRGSAKNATMYLFLELLLPL